MARSLNDLRARSDALASNLDDAEALEVNAAILAVEPGDAVATNRLGAGLIAGGRAAEAVGVFEAGLEAHPANAIMRDRLKQARHAAALPPPKSPSVRGGRRSVKTDGGPTAWIKALRAEGNGDGDGSAAPDEWTWVSDPGQIDEAGERVYRADGQPFGEPQWRVGDKVGLYFGGTYKVPILVEVAELPRFDPEFVRRETGSDEEAERWPWVTPVRAIRAMTIEDAPSLADLGIDNKAMGRRARKKLDGAQRDELLRLLGR
jgi:hypothetical protein